jgi:hypothetical protein
VGPEFLSNVFIALYLAVGGSALLILWKRRLLITSIAFFFSNLPSTSLLFNGAADYVQYPVYYHAQLLLSGFVLMVALLAPRRIRIARKRILKNNISVLEIGSLALMVFITLAGFKFRLSNPDFFWMMHRGEPVISTYTHLAIVLLTFYAVYRLIWSEISLNKMLYTAILFSASSWYWFILGFRSPFLMVLIILIIFYLIRVNVRGRNFRFREVKKYISVASASVVVLLLFDIQNQDRYAGSYEFRLPLLSTALEVHIGTSAGKFLLQTSHEKMGGASIKGADEDLSVLCFFFHPQNYSILLPRRIYIGIAEVLNIDSQACDTFSSRYNAEISGNLREGEGIASNFLADLYNYIGYFSYLIYIAIYLFFIYLDRKIVRSDGLDKQYYFLVCILISPLIFIIWRLNLFSIKLLDLVLISVVYFSLKEFRISSLKRRGGATMPIKGNP